MRYLPQLAAALVAASALVSAHPGEVHEAPSGQELVRRQLMRHKRSEAMAKCRRNLGEMDASLKAKRSSTLRRQKRDIVTSSIPTEQTTYDSLQNTTCVLAPDVTEGPYYINDELVRTNVVEEQAGVPLTLDIGIIDIATCEPATNVYVEIWSCNATGSYSGFASENSGTSGGGGGSAPSGSMGAAVPSGASPSGAMTSGDAMGNTTLAKRQMAGGAGGSTAMSDQDTFLRGGYPINDNGLVEFATIVPGFYTGRTVHTHLMVHSNYSVADNGTVISAAGTVNHIGQIFYDEALLDLVLASSAYTNSTQTRTYNDEDSILAEENSEGNNAYLDYELVGSSIEEGVLGYITIGVDFTNSLEIGSTNYASNIESQYMESALNVLTGTGSVATAAVSAASGAASTAAAATSSASSSETQVSDSTTGGAASVPVRKTLSFAGVAGATIAAAFA